MNNKYLPALICGFGAAVLTTIPGLRSIACCLLVPVASVISIRLYKKSISSNERIETGTGLLIGFLTGIFATIFASAFDILLTYLTRSNDLVLTMPQIEYSMKDWKLGEAVEESIKLMKQMVKEIQTNGFSLLYSVFIILSNFLSYTIFGLIGGAVGTALINRRRN